MYLRDNAAIQKLEFFISSLTYDGRDPQFSVRDRTTAGPKAIYLRKRYRKSRLIHIYNLLNTQDLKFFTPLLIRSL